MVRCSGGELISLCTADMLPILNAIFRLIMVYEWKATYIYISNSSKCGCYTSHSRWGLDSNYPDVKLLVQWVFSCLCSLLKLLFCATRHYPVNFFISTMAYLGWHQHASYLTTNKTSVLAMAALWWQCNSVWWELQKLTLEHHWGRGEETAMKMCLLSCSSQIL